MKPRRPRADAARWLARTLVALAAGSLEESAAGTHQALVVRIAVRDRAEDLAAEARRRGHLLLGVGDSGAFWEARSRRALTSRWDGRVLQVRSRPAVLEDGSASPSGRSPASAVPTPWWRRPLGCAPSIGVGAG